MAAQILRRRPEHRSESDAVEHDLPPICFEIMRDIEDSANSLMRSANRKVFDSVQKFVQNYEPNSIPGIPTGLILAGVNMQDHNIAFSELSSSIRENTSCCFAILTPSNCVTLEDSLESLFQQFSATSNVKGRGNLVGSCSMLMIKTWFEETSPGPLVVLIRDIERFDPQVLADLIAVCSNNSMTIDTSGLPFVFLLAIATSQHSLKRLLQPSSLNQLQVFHSECTNHRNQDEKRIGFV
jgi:hypothetical protein